MVLRSLAKKVLGWYAANQGFPRTALQHGSNWFPQRLHRSALRCRRWPVASRALCQESLQLHSFGTDQAGAGDTDPQAVYSRAATLYRQWRRDGVLQPEPDPAIYVYNQTFDYAGRTYTRRGFMARIRLVRFGEGNIYPHEQTHAKAKDDRLRLTRACQANLSQIFGLYPDPENAAQNLLEQHVAGTAALEAEDHLGVTHRLWPVSDINIIQQVAALVEDKPMFVADGHHRYETACNYRDELAAQAGGQLPAEHPASLY